MTNREEGEILKGRNRYIHFVARRRRRRLVKGTNDGRYAWPIRHSLLSLDWRRRRLMRDEALSKLRFIGAIRWSSSVTSCVARSDENLTRMKSFERERVGDGRWWKSIDPESISKMSPFWRNRFFLESSETSEFVRRNKSIEQWPKETWRHRYPLLLLSNYRHFIRSWIRVYSSNYWMWRVRISLLPLQRPLDLASLPSSLPPFVCALQPIDALTPTTAGSLLQQKLTSCGSDREF